jgi:proteasome accessory factor B
VTDRNQTTIRPEDRLFHLILALMATSGGISKELILQSVRGYREDAENGVSKDTLERRFERDKDTLREMGIPLDMWIPSDDEGNNRNTLYRIPKGKFDHPSDLELSAQDIRLLNVAAAIWREGSLSKDARVAQMKLASHGVTVDEPLLGALPMITARDPALQSLRLALADGVMVQFDYLKPGATEKTTRVVHPLALVMHEGSWHLLSVEGESLTERTFLLRRMSRVTVLDEGSSPVDADRVTRMTQELDELYWSQEARVRVAPGSQAATVLTNRPGTRVDGDTYLLHYTDVNSLADTLCEHGPEVVAQSPPELVEAMVRQLTQVRDTHGS